VSTEPVPPGLIFVESDDALLIYASADAAAQCPHLEELESEAALIAYGSAGEPYQVQQRDGISFVKLDEPARPNELKALLLRYFEACEDPADADEPLEELVERAWTIECGYRERCGPDGEIERRKMPAWGYLALIGVPALILYFALHHR
jgi:hypothetical protein